MIESQQDVIASVVGQFVREELSHENVQIASAVTNMLDAGGKRLRPRITMLAGVARVPGAPEDAVLASYMELIHIATLIHDDVVDAADTRRGRDSTNYSHGNRFSVLAGDYLFAWVFKKITESYASPIPTILSAMLAEICNGEVRQLRAAGKVDLSVDRYFNIIGKKTAELFASCAEVGAIRALQHSGAPPSQALRKDPGVVALRTFAWFFGMAFQVRDDLLDVISEEAVLGKPAGSDLRERRITLPLIYELETGSADFRKAVERYFDGGDATHAHIVDSLRAGRCVERTKTIIADYAGAATAAMAALDPSSARDELVQLARNLTSFSS